MTLVDAIEEVGRLADDPAKFVDVYPSVISMFADVCERRESFSMVMLPGLVRLANNS